MVRLPRTEKRLQQFLECLEWVGIGALLSMMVVTTINVIGAKLFAWNLHGALDMVMLGQLIAITFAAGATLWIGRHVAVEFFVNLLPEKVRAPLAWVVDLMGLVLFVVLVWQLFALGHSIQLNGEVSPTARIPLFPFVYAGAAACGAVCVVYVLRLVRPFTEGGR